MDLVCRLLLEKKKFNGPARSFRTDGNDASELAGHAKLLGFGVKREEGDEQDHRRKSREANKAHGGLLGGGGRFYTSETENGEGGARGRWMRSSRDRSAATTAMGRSPGMTYF